MSFKEPNPKIPMGLASKLEASKETLPAIEVKNRVLWVNSDLDLPFKLEVGKRTNLGLFLTSQIEEAEKLKNLEVKRQHMRSALLGRVIFGEKTNKEDRQLYRDIDIKGLGWLGGKNNFFVKKIELRPDGVESMGILSLEDACHNTDIAEEFHKLGIRTNRTIAIVELEEIIYDGKPISILKAKIGKIISRNMKPVLEIRAFGTHSRFVDVFQSNSKEKANLLIEDARLLVAQELGLDPKDFSRLEYFKWLARTVGKNLALMRKNGWVHKYLGQGHNITLDGCFMDFDSVEKGDLFDRGFSNDYLRARVSIGNLFEFFYGQNGSLINEIFCEYKISYDQNLQ